MGYKTVVKCRICGGKSFTDVLDLGEQPLANKLIKNKYETVALYPLRLIQCQTCNLLQLSIVVNPEEMFTDYPFRSGISDLWKDHCESLAQQTAVPGGKIADIGSNDGTLLECYKKQGMQVLGIDPSNLADECNDKGLPAFKSYWNTIVATTFGPFDIVTALNVLAHTDNLDEFFKAIVIGLKDSGKCIIEIPYAMRMIKNSQFDTIYHEHLSYFTLRPLINLVRKYNLYIDYVRMIEVHGGSLRIVLTKYRIHKVFINFDNIFEKLQIITPEHLDTFESRIKTYYAELVLILQELSPFASVIYCGYGASAKAATFLNSRFCSQELQQSLKFVADDNPDKQYKYIPGVNKEILPVNKIANIFSWVPVVVFSWNIADSLVKKLRQDFKFNNPVVYRDKDGKWQVIK